MDAADRGAPAPSSKEVLFLAAWCLVVLLLCFAPLLVARGATPEGWTFTGLHAGNLNDYQGYMAWMRQARDGHLLFVNKFTDEPHRRLVLHPIFWLIGSFARWTGAPVMAGWLAVEALSLVILVGALWRFAAEFTDSAATRVLAVVLATTACGLGWLWPREGAPLLERPIDLWLPSANGLLAVVSSFFTLTLGLALLLLAAARMRRYLAGGRLRDAAVAGLLALALASVHPYDAVTLYAVLFAWTLAAGRRRLPGLALLAAISAPYMLYGLLATRLDPALAQVTFFMPMPAPSAFALGWGLPLALAALALALPAVRREHRDVALLGLWAGVQLALLAAPLDFRRKLVWGFHAVLCLLAAMALRHLATRLAGRLASSPTARRRVAAGLCLAAVAFLAIGSVPHLHFQLADASFGRFLPAELLDTLEVLDRASEPEDVVLAGTAVSGFVPGWAGATVFAGHWAMTPDFEARQALALELLRPGGGLDPTAARRVLAEHRIRFVLIDTVSLSRAAGRPVRLPEPAELPLGPFTRPLHRSERTLLLEVVTAGSDPP